MDGVEIDTLWNVKEIGSTLEGTEIPVEIDTLWNVKKCQNLISGVQAGGRNRYIVECKDR